MLKTYSCSSCRPPKRKSWTTFKQSQAPEFCRNFARRLPPFLLPPQKIMVHPFTHARARVFAAFAWLAKIPPQDGSRKLGFWTLCQHFFEHYSSILVAFSGKINIFSTEYRNKNYFLRENEDLTSSLKYHWTTDHLENYHLVY